MLRSILYNFDGGVGGWGRCRIKSVSWEYSCDKEYFVKLYEGKILKYNLLPAVLPRNRLDPTSKLECSPEFSFPNNFVCLL